MTRLWLIRHGEALAGIDAGLSGKGQAQMARAAEYLKAEHIAAIYTSPLSRALESARIMAGGLPVEVIPDLREIDFGDFEGLAYDEIAARYPELYRQWMETPTEVRFPNGETFSEMRVRVLRAFDAIRRERAGQTAVIVSHAGVNRILIAWALEMPDRCLFRLGQDYAAMNLLTFIGEFPSVQLLNVTPVA
jgi:alpha-ribazole phosphatase/probable phosphoglycerate mutase